MTAGYVLLAAAEADLRAIVRYTRKQWRSEQARSYVTRLAQAIETIAAAQGPYRDMNALYPGLRMARCEHHYIFCLPREKAPALIVAIFHERMDLIARLGDRLK